MNVSACDGPLKNSETDIKNELFGELTASVRDCLIVLGMDFVLGMDCLYPKAACTEFV